MKDIIDGKEYNTETATQIGKWVFENYSYETLYITNDGNIFFCWLGNPKHYDNDNKKITPASFEEAIDWLYDTDQEEVAKNLDKL